MKALVLSGGADVFIYSLTDPLTNEVRYIGKASNINKRFNRHINESKKSTNTHKRAWIKGLLNKNLNPIIDVVDIIPNSEWKFWEKYWISQFKTWGFNLTNSTKGGDGIDIGSTPWNKGLKGSIEPNKTSFKKGNTIGINTRIKKGKRLSPSTEFKKGCEPHNKIRVLQFDLDNNLIAEYDSYTSAAKNIGVTYNAIKNCILRETFKCKGFIWKKMTNQ